MVYHVKKKEDGQNKQNKLEIINTNFLQVEFMDVQKEEMMIDILKLLVHKQN